MTPLVNTNYVNQATETLGNAHDRVDKISLTNKLRAAREKWTGDSQTVKDLIVREGPTQRTLKNLKTLVKNTDKILTIEETLKKMNSDEEQICYVWGAPNSVLSTRLDRGVGEVVSEQECPSHRNTTDGNATSGSLHGNVGGTERRGKCKVPLESNIKKCRLRRRSLASRPIATNSVRNPELKKRKEHPAPSSCEKSKLVNDSASRKKQRFIY